MKKPKLFTLLSAFSKEEMKKFEKFIASPYFNNERNFKPLYKILKQYHPSFDDPDLTEEKIFKKLYPGKFYDKKSSLTMRVLFSQMTAMAEKFLVYDTLEQDSNSHLVHQALSFNLFTKNQYEYALDIALKGYELIDNSPNQRMAFSDRVDLGSLISSCYYQLDNQQKGAHYQNTNTLYVFGYLFDNIIYAVNAIKSLRQRYNIDVQGLSLFQKLLKGFDPVLFYKECPDDKLESKDFILWLYHSALALVDNRNDDSLNFTIKYFYENFKKHDRNTQFMLAGNIFLVCGRRAREIDFEKYSMIAHKFSEFTWEHELYTSEIGTHIRFIAFYSVFNLKIIFLKPGELQDFVNKYIEKVHADSRESLRLYSGAFIQFKKKEFGKSLECISRLSIVDISIKDNIHKLKIACLYELGYFEETLSAIDSFEHYLKNNKNVYEDTKISGKKFNDGLKILLKIKSGMITEYEIELNNAVKENKNSLFGNWFRVKSEEIFSFRK